MEYKLIWNTEYCTDGCEIGDFDSEEDARYVLKDTYLFWMECEREDWIIPDDGIPRLHIDQINRWNDMIDQCYCYLVPFDEETGDYSDDEEDEIYLTEEELRGIGWQEYVESEETL